jgi:glycosyltransferase involved in cell wall biosynthesis
LRIKASTLPKPLDVVHVIPGDARNKIVEIIVHSDQLAYGVLEIYDQDESMKFHCESKGIQYFTLGYKNKNLFKQFLSLLWWVYLNRPRVMFLHSFYPSVFAVGLFFFCPFTKSIPVRHHNQVHLLSRNRKGIFLDKLVSKFTFRTVAVSNTVKNTLIQQKCDPKKIDVIYNGLDTTSQDNRSVLEPRGERTLRLLAAGRLDWQKNYELMLSVVKELKNQQIDFRLTVLGVGNESYRDQLFELARSLSVETLIDWKGWQPDIHSWFAESDIFIHTALDEACPLVLIEALLWGIPIVTSQEGGSGEVVSEFYPPLHSMTAMSIAAEIVNTWNSLDLARQKAKTFRPIAAEKFGAETMRREYENLALKYLNGT